MVKNFRFSAVLAVLVLGAVSSGCIMSEAHQGVLAGSLAISQGDYQGATIRYLEALDKPGAYQQWVQYDLGNVYHSLGEVVAAQHMWAQAANTSDPNLLFAVRFNQGVAWYESGKYDQAVEAFREALILDSSSVETKINLELALQKNSTGMNAPVNDAPQDSTSQGEADTLRLLEYVERKETAPWQSGTDYHHDEGVNDW